jgi:hypothetical protein
MASGGGVVVITRMKGRDYARVLYREDEYLSKGNS